MGLAAKTSEVSAEAVVVTLDGEGAGLALQVAVRSEDQAAGVPAVRAEGDVPGVRKLRIQAAGRFGSTIPQRPSADFPGCCKGSTGESGWGGIRTPVTLR